MYKKKWFWIVIGVLLFLLILASVFSGSGKSTSTQSTPSATPVAQSREEAQKELDEVMTLSKQAGLVVSYEFSDKASVVFAGATWYTQTVAFKKDFLAKVATLKKAITGYQHFEVRDAFSNEKVGEVTALTGSLEVYK